MRPPRASLRSRESSHSSNDPREKVKDCCRNVVSFMCTQVGVGGLVIGYAIVGAFGFMFVEMDVEQKEEKGVRMLLNDTVIALWDITMSQNVFNEVSWRHDSNEVLQNLQKGLVKFVEKGYDGRSNQDIWSFPAALMFCLSIFTMIGYGNITPKTGMGRGLTVLYAVFGIPLYVLYFMNMGKILASTFRWLYTKLYECSMEKRRASGVLPARVIVPSTACLWVIGGYVLTGTIMFAEWEKWGYLDSVYFCVTSLCKIGIGDFVPGQNISESKEGNQTKLVINFVYLLLGMGLVAMCYNLMRETVRVRVQEIKRNFRKFLDDIHFSMVSCCRSRS